MKYLLALTAAAFLVAGSADPSFAQGKKSGFETTATQGNRGKTNDNANPDNQGQKITTGPKGQVSKGITDCNNCETTGPGNKPVQEP